MPAYYPADMLDAMEREAAAARDRLAVWMAAQTMANMLHVDPQAAEPYGGCAPLRARLVAAYRESLAKDS